MTPGARPGRHRVQGFALVYALLAGLLIITLAAMMAAAQVTRAQSTGNSTRLAATGTSQRGGLKFGERVAAARASRWVKAMEASTDTGAMLGILQREADASLCGRYVHGQALRLHFTTAACGRAVPSGAALQSATRTLNAAGAAYTWVVPYVLVSTEGTTEVHSTGTLRFTEGPLPLSAYAVWAGSLGNLAGVSTTGPLYVNSRPGLSGTATARSVHVGGCTTGSCSASGVSVAGTVGTAMTFSPAPVRICTASGCVSGLVNAQESPSTPVGQAVSATLSVSGGTMYLGVNADGRQRVTHCLATCSTYVYPANTDVVLVTYGNLNLYPEVWGEPSVPGRLTVYATGTVTVGGALNLANPPCEEDVCPASTNILGLFSEQSVTLNAPVMAAVYAAGNVTGGNGTQTVMGAVGAGGTVTNLVVRHDPRMTAREGLAPPLWPRLSSRTNQVLLEPDGS